MIAKQVSHVPAIFALLAIAATALAAEPEPADYADVLPRFAPVEPKDALATMKVQPGFKMELVASEPLIGSPVAICWDERGRMYVVEMRGYSEHRDEKLSRIKLLTDTNDDGIYDEATIFAGGLLWPTAILAYDGGVFVGDAPDILYLKDTDGDGKADLKRRIFTGFGTQNVQGLLNTFLWGLDCRVHVAVSSNGGDVKWLGDAKAHTVSLRGRDFSFVPGSIPSYRGENGGGQHGMTFDDWGHKFVCSNSDHAQQIVYQDHDPAGYSPIPAPNPRVSIAADGPQAAVFRQSPIEPWRVLRTRLRVEGKVPGPVEGGGKPAGYFTGATGITMIRGDAFDETVRGTLIVGDVGSNLVHRKRLKLGSANSPLEYVAERIDQESELVASTDTWFRPAQFANGPDGAIYIIDVYREVIEHPASLPPAIKKHLDLDSGRDRGRIWRLAPAGFKHRPTPRLDRATTAELVKTLEHPNAWHRETASRLLCERHDDAAIEPLAALARDESADPRGRVQALHVRRFFRPYFTAPDDGLIAELLESKSPRVREHAIADVAHEAPSDRPGPQVVTKRSRAKLLELVDDPDPQVRFQLARALWRPDAKEAWLRLLKRDGADPWMLWACLTSSPQVPPTETLALLLPDESLRRDPKRQLALWALVSLVTSSEELNPDDAVRILSEVEKWPDRDAILALRLATVVSDRIMHWAAPRVAKDPNDPVLAKPFEAQRRVMPALTERALARVKRVVPDATQPMADRLALLKGVSLLPWDEVRPLLADLLGPQQPNELQIEALAAIAECTSLRGVGRLHYHGTELILDAWPHFSPSVRRAAAGVLVGRVQRCELLLDAIEKGSFSKAELEPATIELLRNHGTPAIRDRARKAFASMSLAKRQDVVDAYRPVLEMKGDAARGKALFAKSCSACHRLENVGSETGPNLAAMKSRGPEAILLNVLDPNREVNPQYLMYVVTTKEGRTYAGLISGETAASVTLRVTDGRTETIARADIDELRGTGLSLMPEGLEKQIDQPAMADLLAYLMSVK